MVGSPSRWCLTAAQAGHGATGPLSAQGGVPGVLQCPLATLLGAVCGLSVELQTVSPTPRVRLSSPAPCSGTGTAPRQPTPLPVRVEHLGTGQSHAEHGRAVATLVGASMCQDWAGKPLSREAQQGPTGDLVLLAVPVRLPVPGCHSQLSPAHPTLG